MLSKTESSSTRYIHCSKYLKGQMIFSHRHFCNMYPVPRPINSIASGKECSILLQHFEEALKFESRRISRQLMPCLLKWIKFCNFRIFWNWDFFLELYHHKRGFRMIISIRWPYQTFLFIDKHGRFGFGWNFQAFHLFWKISILLSKRYFYKNQYIDLGRMTTGSKLEQSVTSAGLKNW